MSLWPITLNTLTRGPPPMYWLGTSRWCLNPLCMLHFVWSYLFLAFTPFPLPPCLFDSIVRTGWCLYFVAWRMCGLLSSCSLPFIPSWTRRCLAKGPYLPTEPIFSFLASMGLSAIDLTISLYRAYYSFTFPFTSWYPMDLWVDVLVALAHFFINLLLRAS